MSLKLGTNDIAGLSERTKYNAHHLLDFKWTDCIMNDVSWLRADTFSWQSGDVYTSAYNHLVSDISGVTAETETIGNYTVTFYRADDGHKIVLADMESTVLNIYNESGIAWYYILDTNNTRFKLPRTKFGFEGLRTNVGDSIEAGLPNITGQLGAYGSNGIAENGDLMQGAFRANGSAKSRAFSATSGTTYPITFDASRSNSIYGNSSTVQPPATQMYLYFYVGDYNQTAVEQTAGINASLFNGKADIDLSNCTAPHIVETYVSGTSWYRVYSDGWCEQGGILSGGNWAQRTINFLKEYIDTNYIVTRCYTGVTSNSGLTAAEGGLSSKNKASCTLYTQWSSNVMWYACGYIS